MKRPETLLATNDDTSHPEAIANELSYRREQRQEEGKLHSEQEAEIGAKLPAAIQLLEEFGDGNVYELGDQYPKYHDAAKTFIRALDEYHIKEAVVKNELLKVARRIIEAEKAMAA